MVPFFTDKICESYLDNKIISYPSLDFLSQTRDLPTSYALVEVIDTNTTPFIVSTTSHSLTYACIATLIHTNTGYLNCRAGIKPIFMKLKLIKILTYDTLIRYSGLSTRSYIFVNYYLAGYILAPLIQHENMFHLSF